jgi:uncharacterized membrane protein
MNPFSLITSGFKPMLGLLSNRTLKKIREFARLYIFIGGIGLFFRLLAITISPIEVRSVNGVTATALAFLIIAIITLVILTYEGEKRGIINQYYDRY